MSRSGPRSPARARREAATGLRAVVVLALSLPLFAATTVAQPGEGMSDAVEEILFELGDARRVEPSELLDRLVGASDVTLDSVLAAVDGTVTALDRARARRLERGRRDALEDALEELPTLALRRKLEGAAGHTERSINVGLRVLGVTGTGDNLPTAFALAAPAGQDRLPRATARELERSLTDILMRDVDAHRSLGTRFSAVHAALRPSILRAVGAAGQREGLRFFAEVLGAFPELDQMVMTQIGRVANDWPPPHEWSLLLRLRSYLGAERPEMRREAAGTLARMEDREAFPELIAMLTDREKGVSENALWALQRISGKRLGPQPEGWANWYAAQLAWWRDEAPGLIAGLNGGSRSSRVRAIGQMAPRRLFRHDLSKELLLYLDHHDPVLVGVVCTCLGDLRSRVAEPKLVELLRHEDPDVRSVAWLALRRITGAELPLDHGAWLARRG